MLFMTPAAQNIRFLSLTCIQLTIYSNLLIGNSKNNIFFSFRTSTYSCHDKKMPQMIRDMIRSNDFSLITVKTEKRCCRNLKFYMILESFEVISVFLCFYTRGSSFTHAANTLVDSVLDYLMFILWVLKPRRGSSTKLVARSSVSHNSFTLILV